MERIRTLYLYLSTVLGALDLGYHLEVKAFYHVSQVEVPLMGLKFYHFVHFFPLSKLCFFTITGRFLLPRRLVESYGP